MLFSLHSRMITYKWKNKAESLQNRKCCRSKWLPFALPRSKNEAVIFLATCASLASIVESALLDKQLFTWSEWGDFICVYG